ncbi:MAG: TldD/PmbA family protein [Tissierellia bacterium]|nr:TldD/PmbA family protein [Tissierellia bacterium]
MIQSTARRVLEAALSGGADFAEIFLENRKNNSLQFLGGEMRSAISGRDYGLGLRLIKDLKSVYSYTNDTSEENLLAMARKSAKVLQGEKRHQILNFDVKKPKNLNFIKCNPGDYSLKDKEGALRQAYAAAMAYDDLISQASISFMDWDQEVVIINSQGLWVEDRRIRSRFAVSAVADYEGEKQTGFMGPGASMGMELLEKYPPEEIAKEAARIAVTMAKAGYAPSGEMPVVMDKGFGGVLFHEACGHSLEASSVAKKNSVFADKLMDQIASEKVTAIDDGTLPGEWGTTTVDDEGTPTRRNVLIEKGILKSFLVDNLNGKRMNMQTTGSARRESYRYEPTSRMNNTFIAPGEDLFDEMISTTQSGLYAKSLGGGSVNPITGEFNFSVMEGYLIEEGKITKPVRGASLIGKGHEILMKIDAVSGDFALAEGMCGASSGSIPASLGQPQVRISSLKIGGRNAR